jgi:hypothetical protein
MKPDVMRHQKRIKFDLPGQILQVVSWYLDGMPEQRERSNQKLMVHLGRLFCWPRINIYRNLEFYSAKLLSDVGERWTPD